MNMSLHTHYNTLLLFKQWHHHSDISETTSCLNVPVRLKMFSYFQKFETWILQNFCATTRATTTPFVVLPVGLEENKVMTGLIKECRSPWLHSKVDFPNDLEIKIQHYITLYHASPGNDLQLHQFNVIYHSLYSRCRFHLSRKVD